jgi:hypothetical protein
MKCVNKKLNLWFKSLVLFVLFFTTFVFILPYLTSAPNDILVISGLFYLLVVFPQLAKALSQSIKRDIFS